MTDQRHAVSPAPSGAAPSLRQATVLLVSFGLAGAACAGFIAAGRPVEIWGLLFVATASIAAGALALLAFRVWRRRQGEAWPSVEQCFMLAAAGTVLTIGGCGGWSVMLEAGRPVIGAPLGAVLGLGLALVLGAAELFFVVVLRMVAEKLGTRPRP